MPNKQKSRSNLITCLQVPWRIMQERRTSSVMSTNNERKDRERERRKRMREALIRYLDRVYP